MNRVREVGKSHRVTRCGRFVLPPQRGGNGKAQVFKHVETHHAHFGGLETCGSAWACPVCAGKIVERRASEIRTAVDSWIDRGGVVAFVTLTVPHSAQDDLGDMVHRFSSIGLKKLREGRPWERMKHAVGFTGLIRSLETTWGQSNGWHPHSHELWLLQDGEAFDEGFVRDRWQRVAVQAGFPRPSDQYGLSVQFAESTAEAKARLSKYLSGVDPEMVERSPWGAADEIARSHSKSAKNGRFSPWDLLDAELDVFSPRAWRRQASGLFADYVEAFQGKAQVFWTHGLKALFGVEELSDEEIASSKEEKARLLGELDVPAWRRVIRANAEGEILLAAEAGGFPAVLELVRRLH